MAGQWTVIVRALVIEQVLDWLEKPRGWLSQMKWMSQLRWGDW